MIRGILLPECFVGFRRTLGKYFGEAEQQDHQNGAGQEPRESGRTDQKDGKKQSRGDQQKRKQEKPFKNCFCGFRFHFFISRIYFNIRNLKVKFYHAD